MPCGTPPNAKSSFRTLPEATWKNLPDKEVSMDAHISIGAAALMLGVCVNTLRAWHKSGFLVPAYRTDGGHRRYAIADVAAVEPPTWR